MNTNGGRDLVLQIEKANQVDFTTKGSVALSNEN